MRLGGFECLGLRSMLGLCGLICLVSRHQFAVVQEVGQFGLSLGGCYLVGGLFALFGRILASGRASDKGLCGRSFSLFPRLMRLLQLLLSVGDDSGQGSFHLFAVVGVLGLRCLGLFSGLRLSVHGRRDLGLLRLYGSILGVL